MHEWEPPEAEEDVTAIDLLPGQQNTGSVPDRFGDSEDEGVRVSEGKGLGEVAESAFVGLIASAVEQSRCV